MKAYKLLIIFSVIISISLPVAAAEKRSEGWDNLIEFSHKFTWYPRKDLQELLKAKAKEYQQSLEEYQMNLIAELTDGAAVGKSIDPDLFLTPKPWKLYYCLAVAEFCSFLAQDDALYLENAISVLSFISAKKEMANVSFWYFLFQSHQDLRKKDRDAFVKSVFQLWNVAIMQAEINQMIMESNPYQKQLTTDIDYFYENIAHLIITRAVIEDQLPDLHPLSGIVVSLKDKLTLDAGYKRFVEAIVERLKGLKSDNNNLNFAVAFVEATANQYEFEDEKSQQLIVEKYNTARLSYELALSWANTRKGKAAILTQYMGFNNYIVRRLVEKDTLLTSHSVFQDVPSEANKLVDTSIALFDELAKSSNRKNKFAQDGFHKRSNYIEAMHQLWDSISKLLMTLTSYHEMTYQNEKIGETSIAEVFLLKYLTLFQRYTFEDNEIVPDNAFYMAAYSATQLSALYMEVKQYSTSMQFNNLAFAYQLQAVELFPLDILGIMKLAYQTDEENRPRIYFKYVAPLAARLRDSTIVRSWLDENPIEHKNTVAIALNVVPDIVENAFLYLSVLQQTQGSQTEENLYNQLLVMNGLFIALKAQSLDKQIPNTLNAVAKRKFSEDAMPLSGFFSESLAPGIREKVQPPPELKTQFSISRLKNQLYASPEFRIHSFLRELYFEDTAKIHQQLLKLK